MDSMRWSEETTSDAASSRNGNGVGDASNNNSNNGGGNGGGVRAQQAGNAGGGVGAIPGAPGAQQQQSHQVQAAPTIKNHSVTYFNGYLYCFGGYDGRRNHMTLLLYSISERRWIRPSHLQQPPPQQAQPQGGGGGGGGPGGPGAGGDAGAANNNGNNGDNGHNVLGGDPTIVVTGTPPPGRNGHSATLAMDPDDEDNGRIIIIGGWLGTGPLAAADMHILDVSFSGGGVGGGRSSSAASSAGSSAEQPQQPNGSSIWNQQPQQPSSPSSSSSQQRRQLLRWYQPPVKGTPPGPCNMHSADYVPRRRAVYVFRGGNGREYLNDLHALQVDTLVWRRVETTGAVPQQRANHSSAVLEETNELFVFGGWNGGERLNDIHILDTETSNWTRPRVGGVLPHPRAGMTLTALRGRLYLFGGSGTSAKCFQDLQILDRREMAWLDVTPYDDHHHSYNNHGGGGNTRSQFHQQHNDDSMMFRFGGGGGGNGFQDGQHHDGPVQYGDEPDHAVAPQHRNPLDPGNMMANHHQSFTASRSADWRSRDMAVRQQQQLLLHGQHHHLPGVGGYSHGTHASPNPNDEDTVPSVLVHGVGPGRRAGHTATAVNRKIYVFGGSCGSDYLNDFFVLDTDPPPHAVVSEPTSLQLLERRLRHFFNDEEFSDVTFVVQGRRVYGHKMVLSIVSDCFRAMFTTGFKESEACEIQIPDCSHAAFLAVMEYIYTGALPRCDLLAAYHHNNNHAAGAHPQEGNLGRVVEMLELADRFFLDHLKQICETMLQPCVNTETVEYLLGVAQKTNAGQLLVICEHFSRNRDGPA